MSYTNELPEWIREEIDMSLGKKLCPSITDKLLDAANLIESQAARIAELERELAATRSELEAVKDRLRQIDRGDHADRI